MCNPIGGGITGQKSMRCLGHVIKRSEPRSAWSAAMELMKDTRARATGIRRRLWDAWEDSFPLDLDLQQSTLF